jgi:hypothetical protein
VLRVRWGTSVGCRRCSGARTCPRWFPLARPIPRRAAPTVPGSPSRTAPRPAAPRTPDRPRAARRRRSLDGPRRGRRGPSPSRRGRACRATARRSARPRPPVAPRGGRRTGTSRTRAPAPTDPAGSPATGSAAGGVHARTPATRSGRRRRTRDQVQCWAGAGQARRPPSRRRSLRASCRNLRQLGRPNAEVGHPQARCITPARSAPVASPT